MRFCIVGTGRCGSTVLQRIFDGHPDVFVFPETHWIPKMYEWFGASSAPVEMLIDIVQRTKHVTGQPTTQIDHEHLRRSIGARTEMTVNDFVETLALTFAEPAHKKLWADKTPDYGYFMGTLQSIWRSCRFVHVVRDGAAVVGSMARHIGYRALVAEKQLFWCPLSFDYEPTSAPGEQALGQFVSLWRRRMLRLQDESTRLAAGSYLEVRFEELAANPRAVLPEICRFVDLPSPAHWLDTAVTRLDPKRALGRDRTETLRHFDSPARELLEALGYPVTRGAAT